MAHAFWVQSSVMLDNFAISKGQHLSICCLAVRKNHSRSGMPVIRTLKFKVGIQFQSRQKIEWSYHGMPENSWISRKPPNRERLRIAFCSDSQSMARRHLSSNSCGKFGCRKFSTRFRTAQNSEQLFEFGTRFNKLGFSLKSTGYFAHIGSRIDSAKEASDLLGSDFHRTTS